MRGLGLKVSTLSLFVISLAFGFFLFAGCDEEKKEVCCKCTCYVIDGARPDEIYYLSNVTSSCSSSCQNKCINEKGMSLKDPVSVACETVPTDQ